MLKTYSFGCFQCYKRKISSKNRFKENTFTLCILALYPYVFWCYGAHNLHARSFFDFLWTFDGKSIKLNKVNRNRQTMQNAFNCFDIVLKMLNKWETPMCLRSHIGSNRSWLRSALMDVWWTALTVIWCPLRRSCCDAEGSALPSSRILGEITGGSCDQAGLLPTHGECSGWIASGAGDGIRPPDSSTENFTSEYYELARAKVSATLLPSR